MQKHFLQLLFLIATTHIEIQTMNNQILSEAIEQVIVKQIKFDQDITSVRVESTNKNFITVSTIDDTVHIINARNGKVVKKIDFSKYNDNSYWSIIHINEDFSRAIVKTSEYIKIINLQTNKQVGQTIYNYASDTKNPANFSFFLSKNIAIATYPYLSNQASIINVHNGTKIKDLSKKNFNKYYYITRINNSTVCFCKQAKDNRQKILFIENNESNLCENFERLYEYKVKSGPIISILQKNSNTLYIQAIDVNYYIDENKRKKTTDRDSNTSIEVEDYKYRFLGIDHYKPIFHISYKDANQIKKITIKDPKIYPGFNQSGNIISALKNKELLYIHTNQ